MHLLSRGSCAECPERRRGRITDSCPPNLQLYINSLFPPPPIILQPRELTTTPLSKKHISLPATPPWIFNPFRSRRRRRAPVELSELPHERGLRIHFNTRSAAKRAQSLRDLYGGELPLQHYRFEGSAADLACKYWGESEDMKAERREREEQERKERAEGDKLRKEDAEDVEGRRKQEEGRRRQAWEEWERRRRHEEAWRREWERRREMAERRGLEWHPQGRVETGERLVSFVGHRVGVQVRGERGAGAKGRGQGSGGYGAGWESPGVWKRFE